MKKNLLLAIICAFTLFSNVIAQETTIEIGADKTPTSGYDFVPVYDYACYSISQQIYTSEEMGEVKGEITSVSFRLGYATTSTVTRRYAVYMVNTELSSFADGNSFVNLNDNNKVFEGDVVITNAANSWYTINFTEPFNYTGGNVLLCVYDKSGTQLSSNFHSFYKFSVNYNASIYKTDWFGDSAFNVGNLSGGTTVQYKNQIKMTIIESEDGGDDNEGEGNEGEGNEGDEGEAYTVVEIGANETTAPAYYLPTYDFANYSISQQLYTEEDFGGNFGEVTSVSFKLGNNANGAATRQYEVYMKHTDREDMTGSFETMSAENKVFDGDVEISGILDDWFKVTFDTPFNYTGGNVILCVYDKSGTSLSATYHQFHQYAATNRAMYKQGKESFDVAELTSGYVLQKLNQLKVEIKPVPALKVEPETIDLGEAMLGGYWSENESVEVSVRAIATEVTNIATDNAFFTLSEIDYNADPITFTVGYDKNATVDGGVSGNLIVSYGDGTKEIPMTATAYTPSTPDVYELAQEVTFTEGKYTDTPDFAKLHDNYLLPKEVENGNARDAVYAFELAEEALVTAKVTGTNAKVAIYKENFDGKEGPSLDNSYNGSEEVASEFFYDFNDGFIIGWVAKNYDGNNYSWENTSHYYGAAGNQYGVDNTHCIISYSSNNTYGILAADNVIMTEDVYTISENSVLSFDALCMDPSIAGGTDHVRVEVTKDGETYTSIEEITPGYGVFENFEINLGQEFAALGLEYGDYHIALRHKESDIMHVRVDNVRLSNNKSKTRSAEALIYAVPYPAGKYYLVAAAESGFSVELTVVDPDDLPAVPANVVATAIDEFSIELTWDAAERATSYNIYRNDELAANVTELTYIDENLDPNTDYCYVIRAYNDIMESVTSEMACAKTTKLVLTPPTSISAVATSTTTIQLTWSKVEKVAGYKIYWGEDIVDIVSDTTYTVEGLTPSTEYCYMIASVYKQQESFDKSDVACATTLDIVPVVPVNVKVEATSATSVKVSWDESENAKRYYIYNADTLVAKTSYTYYNIVGLTPDTEYCYVVTAVNGEIESEKSEEACGNTLKNDGVEELASSFNIYPNPVNDKLFIETEVEINEVAIYTITGVMVGQQTTDNRQQTLSIDVTDLNSGVYFVKIVTDNGEVVKRFVKN